MKKLSLGVLVSGNGTNLQSIIDHSRDGKIDAKVEVVISDRKDAFALRRAERAGIPAFLVERKAFSSREEFEEKIISILKEYNVDLICLAGFLRILSPRFINEFKWRIMNIHPALLPSFPGMDAQKQAIEYGVKVSGCTVHFVDEGTDTGPIIVQTPVPVMESDTPDTLASRIMQEEVKAFPRAIQLFAEGRLEIKGRRVIIKEKGGNK
jgi:phosphoribosylglycinamide formyltransferase-1